MGHNALGEIPDLLCHSGAWLALQHCFLAFLWCLRGQALCQLLSFVTEMIQLVSQVKWVSMVDVWGLSMVGPVQAPGRSLTRVPAWWTLPWMMAPPSS